MNEPIPIKKDIKIKRQLNKLNTKRDIVMTLLENASWLNTEKKEVIKMMVDIFMDFANELSTKKGFK